MVSIRLLSVSSDITTALWTLRRQITITSASAATRSSCALKHSRTSEKLTTCLELSNHFYNTLPRLADPGMDCDCRRVGIFRFRLIMKS